MPLERYSTCAVLSHSCAKISRSCDMSSQPHQVHIVVDVARGIQRKVSKTNKNTDIIYIEPWNYLTFYTVPFLLWLFFLIARSCDTSSQPYQVHIVVDVARGTNESAKGKEKEIHNLHRALQLSHLLDLSFFTLPFSLARSCDTSSQPHQVHMS